MLVGRWRISRNCIVALFLFAVLGKSVAFSQTEDPIVQVLEQGKTAFKAGHYSDAIETLKKALAIDPDYTMAELYLGASYALQVAPNVKTPENLANAQNAIDTLKRIPDDDGNYHNALKLMALVYRETGQLDDARKAELAALAISDDAETHYAIGVIDWMQANTFALQALASEGLSDDGAGNGSMSIAACTKIKEHNAPLIDDAVTQLTRAIELKYADAMAYLNLVYRRKADLECNDPAARAQDIELANRWAKQAERAKESASTPSSGTSAK